MAFNAAMVEICCSQPVAALWKGASVTSPLLKKPAGCGGMVGWVVGLLKKAGMEACEDTSC